MTEDFKLDDIEAAEYVAPTVCPTCGLPTEECCREMSKALARNARKPQAYFGRRVG
jgi:hypothetical protein